MQIAPFARSITPELAATATTDLERLFFAHEGPICHRWHHMLALYDRVLTRYRGTPVRLLEIGVRFGGSLEIWRSFLGDHATIHGIDTDERCAQFDNASHRVHIGSQSDTGLLDRVVEEMGGVDVVIDDGGHFNVDQITSFRHLYPKLSETGVYICEDTHSSYWSRFGGGPRKRGSDAPADVDPAQASFIEFAKDHIDLLHAWYLDDRSFTADEEAFVTQTQSISFHDSVVVFERGPKSSPFHILAGTQEFTEGSGGNSARPGIASGQER
ncbi:MAG: class I SAM-dependent methyltransferase [Acidimicrobiales bacterium]|nr:MAG: class I SAM-dependent methyltransferase [Acidimicrobiales bacterium]